jgi:peroxiredoxin
MRSGFVVVALFLCAVLVRAEGPAAGKVGSVVEPFALKDAAGEEWSLKTLKDKKAVVVVFVGTECPVNNAYLPKLTELRKAYQEKGVEVVAVNSNRQDTAQRVGEHAKQLKLTYPVLKDEGNVVADLFGARRTPEAFLLDDKHVIRYRGRIDDQYGIGFRRGEPTKKDLVAALDAVLAGQDVKTAETEVSGCLIGRVTKPTSEKGVTYAKEVSRIFQNKCQECHRPGEVGPFSLTSYEDAAGWAAMIREVVKDGRMPPWHADPKHGSFSNDRRLTPAERDVLLGWVDAGCPKGDDKDLPPKKYWPEGWTIGKPDKVIEMAKEYKVPARSLFGIPYQYSMVDSNFEEDVWVQAAEARPGNRAVVHHIIVYVIPPGGQRGPREDGIGRDLLVAYAPGDMPLKLEPGTAKKIKKGSQFVFQMHYTPNGEEATDRSSVALIFAKEPPKQEAKTRGIAQRDLSIPPGEANYKSVSTTTFDRDAVLVSMMPHMHLRGKSFQYEVVYPGDKRETILSVPHYDFGWQTSYRLAKPLALPKGTRIECTAYFDNSPENANNPNPRARVRWGDQTWEEMMIGFVDYYYVDNPDKK